MINLKKIDYFKYRSQLIINCEKIERIDKLDIKDRERFLLIEESNLKSKNQFSLKSLEYIYNYYLTLKKGSEEEKRKRRKKKKKKMKKRMMKKKMKKKVKKMMKKKKKKKEIIQIKKN